MGNYGIKISKAGVSVASTTPSDYIFWSKYQSLPLIQKITTTLACGTPCVGTLTYTHNLGFKAFAIAFTTSQILGSRIAIPFSYATDGDKFRCNGDNFSEAFTAMRMKVNTIEIDYDVECIVPMVSSRCPDVSQTYTIDIYIFMFELGSV